MRWFHYLLAVAILVIGLAIGFVVGYNQAPGNCYLPPEAYGDTPEEVQENIPDGIAVFPPCDEIRADLAKPRR